MCDIPAGISCFSMSWRLWVPKYLGSHGNISSCEYLILYTSVYIVGGGVPWVSWGLQRRRETENLVLPYGEKSSRYFGFSNSCSFYFLRYAGILLGITNSFATIPGMVGPLVAKGLTHSVSHSWLFQILSWVVLLIVAFWKTKTSFIIYSYKTTNVKDSSCCK